MIMKRTKLYFFLFIPLLSFLNAFSASIYSGLFFKKAMPDSFAPSKIDFNVRDNTFIPAITRDGEQTVLKVISVKYDFSGDNALYIPGINIYIDALDEKTGVEYSATILFYASDSEERLSKKEDYLKRFKNNPRAKLREEEKRQDFFKIIALMNFLRSKFDYSDKGIDGTIVVPCSREYFEYEVLLEQANEYPENEVIQKLKLIIENKMKQIELIRSQIHSIFDDFDGSRLDFHDLFPRIDELKNRLDPVIRGAYSETSGDPELFENLPFSELGKKLKHHIEATTFVKAQRKAEEKRISELTESMRQLAFVTAEQREEEEERRRNKFTEALNQWEEEERGEVVPPLSISQLFSYF